MQVNGSRYKRDELAIALVPNAAGDLQPWVAKIEGSVVWRVFFCSFSDCFVVAG